MFFLIFLLSCIHSIQVHKVNIDPEEAKLIPKSQALEYLNMDNRFGGNALSARIRGSVLNDCKLCKLQNDCITYKKSCIPYNKLKFSIVRQEHSNSIVHLGIVIAPHQDKSISTCYGICKLYVRKFPKNSIEIYEKEIEKLLTAIYSLGVEPLRKDMINTTRIKR